MTTQDLWAKISPAITARLLCQIEEQWDVIRQDEEMKGMRTAGEVLMVLMHKLVMKLPGDARDITSICLNVQAEPKSTAVITHDTYGSKEYEVKGMVALVGKITRTDYPDVKLYIKWVSHPFHQYGKTEL